MKRCLPLLKVYIFVLKVRKAGIYDLKPECYLYTAIAMSETIAQFRSITDDYVTSEH